MYIERVPNRNSPPAVLLRSSHWDPSSRSVRKVTHANLSTLPADLVDSFAALLKGGVVIHPDSPHLRITEGRPWGAAAAVLGTARRLGLPALLHSRPSRQRNLALALVCLRLLAPGSRLDAAGRLGPQASSACLNESLGLGDVSEQQLYDTLDWLAAGQPRIEAKLARRHLRDGCLALYDLTSVWYSGRRCALARRGYSRDGKRGSLQILVGLLCDAQGRPVSAEVFPGHCGDPATVPSQIDKLRRRFGLRKVVLVGDRGMLTAARIREDLAPHEDLGWITALRAPALRQLLRAGELQPDRVGRWQLAQVASSEYPGERLLVCRNPQLQQERGRRREDLLEATERELAELRAAAARKQRPLTGDALTVRVHEALGRYKMRKHFEVATGPGALSWRRKADSLAEEASLDGLYVLRAKIPPEERMADEQVVRAYKRLASVERAFRHLKTVDLELRPIYVRHPDRVRAHVLVCMLGYYVEWHLRRRLAPLLYDEEDPAAAADSRGSPVEPACHSPTTTAKRRARATAAGERLWNFRGLLDELDGVQRNRVRIQLPGQPDQPEIRMLTEANDLQRRAFALLDLPLRENLPRQTTAAKAV